MNNAEIGYFIENAKKALNRADVLHFTKYIGIAEDKAEGDRESLAEVLLTEVEGLFKLNLFEQVVQVTEEVEKQVNAPEILASLLSKRGAAYGRLGQFPKAVEILRNLQTDSRFWDCPARDTLTNADSSQQGQGEKGLLQNDPCTGAGDLCTLSQLTVRIECLINFAWVCVRWVEEDGAQRSLLGEAKECCERAVQFAREYDDTLYLQALLILAEIYQLSNAHVEALEVYLEANTRTQGESAEVLNDIAFVYASLGQIDLAQDFLERAEGIASKAKNFSEVAKSNYIRGKMAAEILEDYLKGKDYYLIAFDNYIASQNIGGALKMLKQIAALDQRITDESYTMLLNRLGSFNR